MKINHIKQCFKLNFLFQQQESDPLYSKDHFIGNGNSWI